MKTICIPFTYFDSYRWHRYKRQFTPFLDKYNIIITFTNGSYPDEVIDGVEFVKFDKYPNTLKKGRFYPRGKFGFLRLLWNYYYYYELASYFKDLDVDLLYCFSGSGWFQLVQVLMSKLMNVPSVYRLRGYGYLERLMNYKGYVRHLNNLYDWYSVKQYDYYVPIRGLYTKLLLHYGVKEEKIHEPVGLGVDTDMLYPYNYPDELTVGFIGRFSEEKGINFLFRLMHRNKHIKFRLLGKNDIGLTYFPDNCEYLGYVPYEKVNEFYNSCSVIVLPSYSEGIPNTILESYASGRPVIVSHQAIDESLPLYGSKLNHNLDDWSELFNALSINDIPDVGNSARLWAKKNNWSEFGNRMKNVFRKVIKEC